MNGLITLAALRVAAGYSQEEAAKLVGVCRKTLAKFEADNTKIKLNLLEDFAQLYGWPKDQIFVGSAETYQAERRAASA